MPNQAGKASASEQWIEDLGVVVRALWSFRYELATIAVVGAAGTSVAQPAGDVLATAAIIALVAIFLGYEPTRRWLLGRFCLARVRRRWTRAVRDAGLEAASGLVPAVRRAERIAAGERLVVQVRRGQSISDIEKQAEVIAAALRVREVRVSRDPANASRATVVLVKEDALASAGSLQWPYAAAEWLSIWEPIPVGVDENGETVEISLPERNVLIGGEPGSGKSAALSLFVATAAMDPGVKLWLLDGKMVELAAWSESAEQSVGPSGEDAIELLRGLQGKMEERYRTLLAEGRRKVTRLDGLPLDVVVCDELAFYLTLSDRKQRSEFADLMRDLVSRGRAAGIIVIAATQKPSSDIIPTSLRDLFGFRWAMRCITPQASDTILGSGWASMGFSAAEIPGASRGVGYLLAGDLTRSGGDDPRLVPRARSARRRDRRLGDGLRGPTARGSVRDEVGERPRPPLPRRAQERRWRARGEEGRRQERQAALDRPARGGRIRSRRVAGLRSAGRRASSSPSHPETPGRSPTAGTGAGDGSARLPSRRGTRTCSHATYGIRARRCSPR